LGLGVVFILEYAILYQLKNLDGPLLAKFSEGENVSYKTYANITRVSQRLEFEGHLRGKNGIIGTLMDLVMG